MRLDSRSVHANRICSSPTKNFCPNFSQFPMINYNSSPFLSAKDEIFFDVDTNNSPLVAPRNQTPDFFPQMEAAANNSFPVYPISMTKSDSCNDIAASHVNEVLFSSQISSSLQNNDSSSGSNDLNVKSLSTQFYKTRVCPFAIKGLCKKGAGCTYAHDATELRIAPDLFKTKLCDAWKKGSCSDSNCR